MSPVIAFGEDVAARVPALDEEDLVVRAGDLSAPPTELDAPDLVAVVGRHIYDPSYAVQRIDVFGSRRAYRALGLVALAQLLHRGPRHVRVRLAGPDALTADPAAEPRHVPEMILLELPEEVDPSARCEGLGLTVDRFTYRPAKRARHPFADVPDVWSLPSVHLTSWNGMGEDRPEAQVAVRGFGTLEGVARMVQLLLDISQPASTRRRFDLECEAGCRGVAPASHEMGLILPGDEAWLLKPGFAALDAES